MSARTPVRAHVRAGAWGLVVLPLLIAAAQARIVPVATWPALLAACQSALPGDTIVIAAGVYTITNASRIMVTNRPGPVLVKGATGNPADVVVEGAGQDDASVQMAFNLDNAPQWTFRDLTTRNTYYHGFKFDHASTDCRLIHVVMRDHGESGVKGTSDPAAGTYPDRLLVEDCDIGFTAATGGTRSVVEGIDGVGVNDWIVRNSRFVNVQKNGAPAYAVFTKGNSSNTLIEGCRFERCFIGASFGGGGTAPQFFRDGDQTYEHRNGVIRNNLIIDCDDAGVYINKGHDARVYHNTLVGCVLTIQFRFAESTGRARNNLVVRHPGNPNEPVVRLRDGATLQFNDMNIAGTAADFVLGTGPAALMDLHLVSSSPAVDAGVALGAECATDFEGQPRPFGAGPDIGADELGTVPVEIAVFTAARAGSDVRLAWRTETERNNARFDVLRAEGGDTRAPEAGAWRLVGTVAGAGSAEEAHEYAFIDRDAPAGAVWYRLDQIDFDGTRTAGRPLFCAERAEAQTREVALHPNPASGAVTLTYELAESAAVDIAVYDARGARVMALAPAGTGSAGMHAVSFSTAAWAKGAYRLVLRRGARRDVRTIVVE